MVYSMTGFGAATSKHENLFYKIEIRSLNSKSLDINIKLPSELKFLEAELRNLLSTLIRGKIDVLIQIEENIFSNEANHLINTPLLLHYYNELNLFIKENKIDNLQLLNTVLGFPHVILDNITHQDQKAIVNALSEAIKEAIHLLSEHRKTEGISQYQDLKIKLKSIETSLAQIAIFEPLRIAKIRERYESELKNLIQESEANPGRLEMELIFYIEKLDINEEKVRLNTHIEYFREILNDVSSIEKGKKLGFLAQEMGREINTIGSKANDSDIQKQVILMKDDLEKIKEQVNNIL
ncbi:MAG: YicC family protein [Chitinophagales bacterium]|nr:YicC family protein [Chitinophagales bacterium]MCZ2393000.1 YicC family protein [Chitinophagales bacterium]